MNKENFINLRNDFGKKTKDEKLNLIRKIVESKCGKLISNEWLNIRSPLDITDENNIKCSLNAEQILRNIWPSRNKYISEELCNQVLTHLFKYKFYKTRQILKSSIIRKDYSYELDGYCKELNIAFEYQGHQSHWKEDFPTYIKVRERDLFKRDFCKKNNIILIIIPPLTTKSYKWEEKYLISHILDAIKKSYHELNLVVPDLNFENFEINQNNLYSNKEFIFKMEKIAENNEGKLLSKIWKGSSSSYKFKDKQGIEFEIKYSHLLNRGWPKNVEKFLKLGDALKKDKTYYLNFLREEAINNNAELLSEEWTTSKNKYKFKFNDGREFEILASEILKGHFPKNADLYFKNFKNKMMTSEEKLNNLKELAIEKNCKLLSNEWKGSKEKYVFENQFGEIHEMLAESFKNNGFPKNKNKIKLQ